MGSSQRGGAHPPARRRAFGAACDPPALRLAGAFGPRAGTGKEEPVGLWPCRRRADGVGGAAAWPPFPEGDARGRGMAGPCAPVLPFPGDAGRGRGGRLARVGCPCGPPPFLSCGGLGRPAAPHAGAGARSRPSPVVLRSTSTPEHGAPEEGRRGGGGGDDDSRNKQKIPGLRMCAYFLQQSKMNF